MTPHDTISPEVLLYHRIVKAAPDNQYLSVTPENFADHLDILSRERRVLPLYDLVQAAAKGHLVPGGVAITFDDGYADNLINALPLLEKYHCHATIFVTAGLLGHPYGFWYDVLEDVLLNGHNLPTSLHVPLIKTDFPLNSPAEILSTHELLFSLLKQSPARMVRLLLHEIVEGLGLDSTGYVSPHPLLTAEQVRELSQSPWVEIGAHTLHHPVLASLTEDGQRVEILQSKNVLEGIIDQPVRILAYPYGNKVAYNACTQRITQEAGLLGIANIQGSLTLPLDSTNVPRRLVRNWTGRQVHHWLRAADRSALERQTLENRVGALYHYLEGRQALPRISPMQQVPATEKPTRITHITTMMGQGGTAKIVQLLLAAQEAAGHQAAVITGKKMLAHDHIHMLECAPQKDLTAYVQREGLLDYALQGSHGIHRRPELQHAQILHFHNLHGGYFHPFSLAGLSRLRPSVWTLHDMQALTGHCAHAFDCSRWQDGCGLCPHLEVYPQVTADNTHRLWRDKERIYACSPVHVVTPSRWLAAYVSKSLLRNHPVDVIPNGIDTQVFCPQDKASARAKLGISPHTLVVGNAAYSGPLHNFWKGGAFALEALEHLKHHYPDVLFLGRGNAQDMENAHIRLLPYAYDEHDMATFYAALDFLLYPSLADNCPLVVLEAMACGIPTLAFQVGGIPELIEHGHCGLLVPARDSAAFCQAASTLAEDADLRHSMGQAARERAVALYDARHMAQTYEALYEKVQETWPAQAQQQTRLHKTEVSPCVRTPAFLELARVAHVLQEAHGSELDTQPRSRLFGLDRGTPVDRVYIEQFLSTHAQTVRGTVLEVAGNVYTRKFDHGVSRSEILHATPAEQATIVGDLATGAHIPRNTFDCIILTQTLQFIYDCKHALQHSLEALAPGGTLLLTASGISQISRYDMDRWGEFWRFTDRALHRLLQELAPDYATKITTYGNAYTAKAFLDGLAAEELPPAVFEKHDKDYQVTVCACVTRPLVEQP